MLKQVAIHSKEPLTKAKYISTSMLTASRDGKPLQWEMINSLPTVHILVNKVATKEMLLVKQVRLPVLYNRHAERGECIEACAGLVDKYNHLNEEEQAYLVAKEEISEELGYATNDILQLQPMLSSVGTAGNKIHLFYAEVSDENYVGQSLEPTEDIEVVKLPYKDILPFTITTANTDATTVMLLQWWLLTKG